MTLSSQSSNSSNSPSYILSLDQGTTSSRAILFDQKGQIIQIAQKLFKQIFPKPGHVEHNPQEIWSSQATVIAEVISKTGINGHNIAAIGITNQRETCIIWNRKTGKPIYNAIVWQDRRTAHFCSQLKEKGYEPLIQAKTGLLLDPYFSATKIRWILDNVKDARSQAERGELCFGTIDTWLIWNLTNPKHRYHLTDVSNASRTSLFNIHTLQWDEELLDLFDIPKSILPEVHSSSEVYCKTATTFFSSKIPISGIAGDQQAALFGQLCTSKGMLKTTYGTGCFMMMNTGATIQTSHNKLLSTIAWQINGKTTYALEGSVFIGGAIIQWLRDELGTLKNSAETELLAQSLNSNEGVYLIPALSGLGAPHWKPEMKGSIHGITRGTNRAHIARAALESIAYQVYDLTKAMEKDTHLKIPIMRVDGGATNNTFLMQFQSNILNCPVDRPKILESTALGAAYLAGLAINYYPDINTLQNLREAGTLFKPDANKTSQQQHQSYVEEWHKILNNQINK